MAKSSEPEDDGFLSVAETAALWGVSPKTVRREIECGALRVVRLGPAGRILRTTRRDREAYLAMRAATGVRP